MSERSSFVTEYICCDKCLNALLPFLTTKEKYLCGVQIPSWNKGEMLPIIAGKVGASYSGGEWETLNDIFEVKNVNFICHPVRIAVLHDNGYSTVFIVYPDGTVDEFVEASREKLVAFHEADEQTRSAFGPTPDVEDIND